MCPVVKHLFHVFLAGLANRLSLIRCIWLLWSTQAMQGGIAWFMHKWPMNLTVNCKRNLVKNGDIRYTTTVIIRDIPTNERDYLSSGSFNQRQPKHAKISIKRPTDPMVIRNERFLGSQRLDNALRLRNWINLKTTHIKKKRSVKSRKVTPLKQIYVELIKF